MGDRMPDFWRGNSGHDQIKNQAPTELAEESIAVVAQ